MLDKPFGIITETMQRALAVLDENLQRIAHAQASNIVKDEFTQVANLMRHACQRGLFLNGDTGVTATDLLNDLENLIPQQRLNWLARNRPGGLKDSIKRFEPVLRQYRDVTGDVPSYL